MFGASVSHKRLSGGSRPGSRIPYEDDGFPICATWTLPLAIARERCEPVILAVRVNNIVDFTSYFLFLTSYLTVINVSVAAGFALLPLPRACDSTLRT